MPGLLGAAHAASRWTTRGCWSRLPGVIGHRCRPPTDPGVVRFRQPRTAASLRLRRRPRSVPTTWSMDVRSGSSRPRWTHDRDLAGGGDTAPTLAHELVRRRQSPRARSCASPETRFRVIGVMQNQGPDARASTWTTPPTSRSPAPCSSSHRPGVGRGRPARRLDRGDRSAGGARHAGAQASATTTWWISRSSPRRKARRW